MAKQSIVSKVLSRLTDLKKDTARAIGTEDAKSITFVAINGAGLGHLTRCLSVACELRRLHPELRITFFTTSIAVHLVARLGFECHHCPPISLAGSQCTRKQWRTLLHGYLEAHLEHTRAATLVFDGTIPYQGIVDSIKSRNNLKCVWIKRGLYKQGMGGKTDKYLHLFDTIILPTELNQPQPDTHSKKTVQVPPIVSCDLTPQLTREAALQELNLSPEHKYVYIQLGAGNINENSLLEKHVIAQLNNFGDFKIVRGQSPISLTLNFSVDEVETIEYYPNSKYFKAFEFAVLAAGYNSVYETIYSELPAIFVPNQETSSDDQIKRAQIPSTLGPYAVSTDPLHEDWGLLIEKICAQNNIFESTSGLDFENGAVQAASEIFNLLSSD